MKSKLGERKVESSLLRTPMTFEDLEGWRVARALVSEVYQLSRSESIAKDFGLVGQLQRAGVSIMNNIAEGFERVHLQEKSQFYNVSRGSCGEVRSMLYVVEDNYPILASEAVKLRQNAVKVGKLVSGLILSTESRKIAREAR